MPNPNRPPPAFGDDDEPAPRAPAPPKAPPVPPAPAAPTAPGPTSHPPTNARPGAPWSIVAVLCLLLGGAIGALVMSWWERRNAPVPQIVYLPAPPPAVVAPSPPPSASAPASAPANATDAARSREVVSSATPKAPAAPAPADVSPDGLLAAFGASILTLTAEDERGGKLPPGPAVVVARNVVLAPWSALDGGARATLRSTGRASFPVTGVVAQNAQLDLVLLAFTAPDDVVQKLPLVPFAAAGLPTAEPCALLPSIVEQDGAARLVVLSPGAIDPRSGGPRFEAKVGKDDAFFGAAFDARGGLVALAPGAGPYAIPTAAASQWPMDAGAAIAIDAFLKNLGPASTTARLRLARALLKDQRYMDAARAFLQVLAEDARLLQDARADLITATTEAARASVGSGDGQSAFALLRDVLRLIADDAELWAAQGRALAMLGNVAGSIDAFRQGAAVDPKRARALLTEARGILMDAVNVELGRGEQAAALALLLDHRRAFPDDGKLRMTAGQIQMQLKRFLEAEQLFREAATLDATVSAEALASAQKAHDLAGGPGAVIVDFDPGVADIVVTARLNASVSVRLRVDESAQYVMLPPALATAAGYVVGSVPRIRWFPDPKAPEVPKLTLSTISVNGVQQAQVDALLLDGQAGGTADGVLGASFLGRFRKIEDRALGRMVLYPR